MLESVKHKRRNISEDELSGFVFDGFRIKLPNPIPFLRLHDANNMNNQDILDCNPPHKMIEFGLKWSF